MPPAAAAAAADSDERDGNAGDNENKASKKKTRKSRNTRVAYPLAAPDRALPHAGWQDVEAGAPERAAGPSPPNTGHDLRHGASPSVLIMPGASSVAVSRSAPFPQDTSGYVAVGGQIQSEDQVRSENAGLLSTGGLEIATANSARKSEAGGEDAAAAASGAKPAAVLHSSKCCREYDDAVKKKDTKKHRKSTKKAFEKVYKRMHGAPIIDLPAIVGAGASVWWWQGSKHTLRTRCCSSRAVGL